MSTVGIISLPHIPSSVFLDRVWERASKRLRVSSSSSLPPQVEEDKREGFVFSPPLLKVISL